MMHCALYLTEPGDVLAVGSQPETSGAQWGDVAARYALKRGLADVMFAGCIRDTDALEELLGGGDLFNPPRKARHAF
jgi:4-hydroxy-4-methyl-2-oxoglutarate aldolase